jgi:hypothetical protein
MIIKLLFPVLVIAALVLLAVWMVSAIRGNVRTGNQPRQDLLRRLEALPLARMLEARGIDPRRYLHDRKLRAVERQMRECAACAGAAACADDIAAGAANRARDYCPNYADIGDNA